MGASGSEETCTEMSEEVRYRYSDGWVSTLPLGSQSIWVDDARELAESAPRGLIAVELVRTGEISGRSSVIARWQIGRKKGRKYRAYI